MLPWRKNASASEVVTEVHGEPSSVGLYTAPRTTHRSVRREKITTSASQRTRKTHPSLYVGGVVIHNESCTM